MKQLSVIQKGLYLVCVLLLLSFTLHCSGETPAKSESSDTEKVASTEQSIHEQQNQNESNPPAEPTSPDNTITPPDSSEIEQTSPPEGGFEPNTPEETEQPGTIEKKPVPEAKPKPPPERSQPKDNISPNCPKGQTDCTGTCADLKTSTKHCGGCGKSCKSTQGCFDGKCLTTSKLWGKKGELFKPQQRLMDWSYAGYAHGEKALPVRKVTIKLTDFGAIANDGKDDTAAFEKAIAKATSQKGSVIGIPKGTFRLTKRVRLPSNTVIQGAGMSSTILDLPKSLTDVYGNKGLSSGGTSSYSFGGAFIEIRGGNPRRSSNLLATITSTGKRGATTYRVNSTQKLKVGLWVIWAQTDVKRSLMNHLHAGLMTAGTDNEGDTWTFMNRIKSIKGSSVTFERPLPVDVRSTWKPSLYGVGTLKHNIGIEHLTFRFPKTAYPGHFKERGYNAIDFYGGYNSWVRKVRIYNADYGVNYRSSYNLTADGVELISQRPKNPIHGHHGLNIGHGGDHLLIRFKIDATFQHDITVEWYSTGNVITKGSARNIRMDHHRAAPYLTLWTELNIGEGTTPFVSGGRGDRGPHTAAYSTFWNFTAKRKIRFPPSNYGPRMNFIAFPTGTSKSPSKYDWWIENIPANQLGPPNLWEAMRLRRLGRK